MSSFSTGQPPFGFCWKGTRLVRKGNESHIRTLIFELFEQHRSKTTVANLLNEQGYRTRRNSKWSDVTVSRQLTCSSAIGIYAVNKTIVDESGTRIERPKEEWDFVDCEAIIPKDLWDRVQSLLEEPSSKSPSRSTQSNTPFSGVLRCACGKPMSIPSGSSKFACRTCGNRIPSNDLEEIFLGQFKNLINTRPDLFADSPVEDESTSEASEQLVEAQEHLSETKRSMAKFEQLFAANELTLERFSEVHGPLEEKREALTQEVSRLRSLSEKQKPETTEEEEGLAFHLLIDHWPNLPLQDQRDIVSALLDEIVIGDGEVEFRYSFPENLEEFSKDASTAQQTADPTNGPVLAPNEPLYIRLPASGSRCKYTGLSRSKLNELVLPNKRNSYKPPVQSLSIKLPGRLRGTRLIIWPSLKRYLAEQTESE